MSDINFKGAFRFLKIREELEREIIERYNANKM